MTSTTPEPITPDSVEDDDPDDTEGHKTHFSPVDAEGSQPIAMPPRWP